MKSESPSPRRLLKAARENLSLATSAMKAAGKFIDRSDLIETIMIFQDCFSFFDIFSLKPEVCISKFCQTLIKL